MNLLQALTQVLSVLAQHRVLQQDFDGTVMKYADMHAALQGAQQKEIDLISKWTVEDLVKVLHSLETPNK